MPDGRIIAITNAPPLQRPPEADKFVYAFANKEPVTLLNGAELLGLLKKHGFSFRINQCAGSGMLC
jgi:hypothetical protein